MAYPRTMLGPAGAEEDTVTDTLTDLAALDRWIDRYERAWRSNDAGQVADLFTEDAVYRWRPWEDGAVGRDAIVEGWLAQPDDPSTWTMECDSLAVEGDLGVARCIVRYAATRDRPARTYHDLWLVRLTGDGRCREFTEHFMEEPAASG